MCSACEYRLLIYLLAVHAQEVEQVIAAMMPDMSQHDLVEAFKQMDEDGSGEVDFSEFGIWWQEQGDTVQVRVASSSPFTEQTFKENHCLDVRG